MALEPVNTTLRGVCAGVETLWAFAVGGLPPGCGPPPVGSETLIDTVATALVLVPSLTVKVKLSTPAKPFSGV